MKSLVKIFSFLLVIAPVVAQAQFGGIDTFIGRIIEFIDTTLVPLVFALAFIVFLWGVFTYFIRGGNDPEKQKEGKNLMLYGIVGFVIMVSVWGIVNLIANGLGYTTEQIYVLPDAPYTNP
ncbi:pilin [Candidatus Kaiserbacteria bacterium]|nr:pilin [Candidatus Kaiserbacteria bacterium]